MRRLRDLALVATVTATLCAGPSTTHAARPAFDVELGRAVTAQGIAPSRTAAIAIDLRSGQVVFSQNARRSLLPASAEKLAVSYAALRVLGPGHRFHTEVVASGARTGRVWRGDLGLVGYGDPTLTVADLDRLARRVAATGITRIAGRIVGDDTHFDSQRQAPGWKPSYLGIESRPLSALSVAGVLSAGANGSAAAVARAFADALRRRGVRVSGTALADRAPANAVPIAFDLSEPLWRVARRMNGDSDNFVAEMVLKELGATIAERGSSASGAKVVRSSLSSADVPLAGVRIADGSGLSRFDRVTVRALADIIVAGATDPSIRDAFVGSLAVAGHSGTLLGRLDVRPTRGRVRAKTGTTNRSSALAGLVRDRYVFAILHNGSPVPYWSAREAQDRFVTALART